MFIMAGVDGGKWRFPKSILNSPNSSFYKISKQKKKTVNKIVSVWSTTLQAPNWKSPLPLIEDKAKLP